MKQMDENILNQITRLICAFEKEKGQVESNINKKNNLNDTLLVDKNPFCKVKIHTTMECNDIIDKNMESGKVTPQPLMIFLQEQNTAKNEAELNERLKKAYEDSILYGITNIEIAFNDINTLNRLSDIKVDENYYLLWLEASISYVKYLLNNKQLKIEYPKQSIFNNIHKEIETARKER